MGGDVQENTLSGLGIIEGQEPRRRNKQSRVGVV